MFESLLKILRPAPSELRERGVITMAEVLIVLGVAAAVAMIWTNAKLTEMEGEAAQLTGRNIAAYSRAAAQWLAEAPPAADGNFDIAALQDCAVPNGARFLPCDFNANSPLPHVLNAAGDPATFGDLTIVVDILPAGADGDIDFGVFRSGDDDNGDGLPDSRPDLAAIAFRAASEETGAGVFEFFRLQFARADLTGLVLDPTAPGFDQNEVDNLARLRAEIGAQVDAPFLRVDGGNEMNAGLTFNNGMQINMQGGNLEFDGAGIVLADTLEANTLEANTLEADASTLQSVTVNPPAGVLGAGFDRLDQSADIIRIDGTLADHDTRITANAGRITANQNAIAANLASITTNQRDIGANRVAIANNAGDIATNRGDIAANSARITANRNDINTNRRDIAGNARAIGRLGARPTIPSCSRTRSSVIALNPGKVYWDARNSSTNRLCSSFRPPGLNPACWNPTVRVGGVNSTYQTRNSQTLQCDNNSITFYTSCCVTATGDCRSTGTTCAPQFPPGLGS